MRILVTAGNTQTPIDRVRCLTNIFSGRTGADIAVAAESRGHSVTFVTSRPEVFVARGAPAPSPRWEVRTYQTFDDLHGILSEVIRVGRFDVVIHAAAVGDYHLGGTYAPAPGTTFDLEHGAWRSSGPPHLINVSAGKVKSTHPELWLRLIPTVKLIDLFREPWGFRGVLVKFKLEVGLSRDELLRVAEQSRLQSRADLMVANTLEGRHTEAFIGAGDYQSVARPDLPIALLKRVEGLAKQG